MGVKLGFSYQVKNRTWEYSRNGFWGKYFGLRGKSDRRLEV